MKIKQQKMIKAFLIEEFGSVKGTDLFSKQVVILDELIKRANENSYSNDSSSYSFI